MIKIKLDEVSKDQNTRIEVLRCNSEGRRKGWAALEISPPRKPSLIRMTPMATPINRAAPEQQG